MPILLALLLSAPVCPVVHRSHTTVHEFMKQNPCPGGPDEGSTKRCRGYKADHVIPLCSGGPDQVANLTWQTTADAAQKDKTEKALCAWIRKLCVKPVK